MTGAVPLQVTVDCADPGRLAVFWGAALRYTVQFEDPTNAWSAVVDPELRGPRLVFQRVPEPKVAKNRTHLDLQVGQDALFAELHRLTALGARVMRNLAADPETRSLTDSPTLQDTTPAGWRRFILADPEGNEFCLQ